MWDLLPNDFRQLVDQTNRISGLMHGLVYGVDPPDWTQEPSPDAITAVRRNLTFLFCKNITVEEAEQYVPLLLSLHYPDRPKKAEVLLAASIVLTEDVVTDGHLIEAVGPIWFDILREIERDPNFLFRFAQHPRKFEEFIAASYKRAGWPEVILTPRSNDGGRDVIAVKPGFGSIRLLEQCKAYSPGTLVTHDDVRAMLGVLQADRNSSKAIITTTSDFQPGILTSEQLTPFMPHRLELRNGSDLIRWLLTLQPNAPDDKSCPEKGKWIGV